MAKRLSPSKARHFKKRVVRRWNKTAPPGHRLWLMGSPYWKVKVQGTMSGFHAGLLDGYDVEADRYPVRVDE